MYKCKECDFETENAKSIGTHVRNSHSNFKFKKSKYERIEIEKECYVCLKKFSILRKKKNGEQIIDKKEKKTCSRTCANKRNISNETKNKISNSLKKTICENPLLLETRKRNAIKTVEKRKSSKGRKRSKETCDKIRQSKLSNPQFFSEETRKKLSISAFNRKLGGHNSKKRVNFIKKDGTMVHLHSSYESRLAEILEEMNIKWERPNSFIWIDENNKKHRYYPDFHLIEKSIFIDTKNDYLIKVDEKKIKFVKEQNNLNLIVLSNEMINEEYIKGLLT